MCARVKLVFCKRNFKEKKKKKEKEKEKEKRKKKNYFLLFFLEILYFLQEIPTPFLENTWIRANEMPNLIIELAIIA